jgi:hypothetical protein
MFKSSSVKRSKRAEGASKMAAHVVIAHRAHILENRRDFTQPRDNYYPADAFDALAHGETITVQVSDSRLIGPHLFSQVVKMQRSQRNGVAGFVVDVLGLVEPFFVSSKTTLKQFHAFACDQQPSSRRVQSEGA